MSVKATGFFRIIAPGIIILAALAPALAQDLTCTNCHGEEAKRIASPDCSSCHVGTALHAKGQLRFRNSVESDGVARHPADGTFAVNSNKTYDTSVGHAQLKCKSCHGDQHAQPHMKVVWDCAQCHKAQPSRPEGPHGMHPTGQGWVRAHGLQVDENGAASCIGCHASDGRGTELSQAFVDRSFETKFGHKEFAKGTPVGCYSCHAPSGASK